MCVRPADGFFFPISYDAPRSQFAADEAACAARCHGGRLYYYAYPGGSIDDAVDRQGEAYRDSPSAFAFRTAYFPGARCDGYGPAKPIQANVAATSPPAAPPVPLDAPDREIRVVGPFYNLIQP